MRCIALHAGSQYLSRRSLQYWRLCLGKERLRMLELVRVALCDFAIHAYLSLNFNSNGHAIAMLPSSIHRTNRKAFWAQRSLLRLSNATLSDTSPTDEHWHVKFDEVQTLLQHIWCYSPMLELECMTGFILRLLLELETLGTCFGVRNIDDVVCQCSEVCNCAG